VQVVRDAPRRVQRDRQPNQLDVRRRDAARREEAAFAPSTSKRSVWLRNEGSTPES
jgi:hypothetical protein